MVSIPKTDTVIKCYANTQFYLMEISLFIDFAFYSQNKEYLKLSKIGF